MRQASRSYLFALPELLVPAPGARDKMAAQWTKPDIKQWLRLLQFSSVP